MFFVLACQVVPENFHINDMSIIFYFRLTFSLAYSLSLSLDDS